MTKPGNPSLLLKRMAPLSLPATSLFCLTLSREILSVQTNLGDAFLNASNFPSGINSTQSVSALQIRVIIPKAMPILFIGDLGLELQRVGI